MSLTSARKVLAGRRVAVTQPQGRLPELADDPSLPSGRAGEDIIGVIVIMSRKRSILRENVHWVVAFLDVITLSWKIPRSWRTGEKTSPAPGHGARGRL